MTTQFRELERTWAIDNWLSGQEKTDPELAKGKAKNQLDKHQRIPTPSPYLELRALSESEERRLVLSGKDCWNLILKNRLLGPSTQNCTSWPCLKETGVGVGDVEKWRNPWSGGWQAQLWSQRAFRNLKLSESCLLDAEIMRPLFLLAPRMLDGSRKETGRTKSRRNTWYWMLLWQTAQPGYTTATSRLLFSSVTRIRPLPHLRCSFKDPLSWSTSVT